MASAPAPALLRPTSNRFINRPEACQWTPKGITARRAFASLMPLPDSVPLDSKGWLDNKLTGSSPCDFLMSGVLVPSFTHSVPQHGVQSQ